MADDEPAQWTNSRDYACTNDLVRVSCGIVIYLLVACFAVAVIVASIHDYNYGHADLGLFLIPRVVFHVRGTIAGLAVPFITVRLIYHLRLLRRLLKAKQKPEPNTGDEDKPPRAQA
jgi:hypothetical protein